MDVLSEWFKLCADPTRLRILMVLRERSACVCQLCALLSLSQPKVSKHLARLKAAGHVKDERRDKYVYYSFKVPSPLFGILLDTVANHRADFDVLRDDKARLEQFDFEACLNGQNDGVVFNG